jgi:molybdopterin-binding protein
VSGRNQLVGRVESGQFGGSLAEARLSIGGQQVTSVITVQSGQEMQLKWGRIAAVLIKASEVMILRF